MGKYTTIADISGELIRILRQGLVPGLITDEGAVGLCSPDDRGDMSLGLFLYDLQECEEIRGLRMIDVSQERQQYPPVYLSLYYMITAYSQSDRQFRLGQEERILGRVIQCLHNQSVIWDKGEQVQIRQLRISAEDKIRLWNFQKTPYTLSLYYKAAPVMLESDRTREVDRVRSVEIGLQGKQRGGQGK